MRIIDKTFKIRNYRLYILFTHFSLWKLRYFRIFGKRSFLRYGFSIVLLGFQVMMTLSKDKEVSIEELKQIIRNGTHNNR